jgi:hypothetical protein
VQNRECKKQKMKVKSKNSDFRSPEAICRGSGPAGFWAAVILTYSHFFMEVPGNKTG